MRYTNTDLTNISKEVTLRQDCNYIMTDIDIIGSDYFRFEDVFSLVTDNRVDVSDIESFYYVEIGNVSKNEEVNPTLLAWDERNELNENYFKKIEKGDIIKAEIGDILISKVRPNLKKYIFIDEQTSEYYYTSAFIHIRPKVAGKAVFYALKTLFYRNLIGIARQGKGYPTLSERDLSYLKFEQKYINPLVENYAGLIPTIESKEKEITLLREQIKTEQSIINNVFNDYFRFNITSFYELKKQKYYLCDAANFANNIDVRNSAKFHRPAGDFVLKELTSRTNKRIKHFINEPIVLGASISPADFDESGDYYYISMATVKNLIVELDDTQITSIAYSNNNISKSVRRNDIIMTRSGVAIGKFALVEEDIQAIHADFTMRIRLENINPLFAYYYFRTQYFQYLIEVNKKGVQNQNIFPGQIQEFPMLDIPSDQQDSIVEKIKAEITKQNEIRDNIAKLRGDIDRLILTTVKEVGKEN